MLTPYLLHELFLAKGEGVWNYPKSTDIAEGDLDVVIRMIYQQSPSSDTVYGMGQLNSQKVTV